MRARGEYHESTNKACACTPFLTLVRCAVLPIAFMLRLLLLPERSVGARALCLASLSLSLNETQHVEFYGGWLEAEVTIAFTPTARR